MANQLTSSQVAHAVARFQPRHGLTCADLHARQFATATAEIRSASYLTRWAATDAGQVRPAQPGEFTWLITHNN